MASQKPRTLNQYLWWTWLKLLQTRRYRTSQYLSYQVLQCHIRRRRFTSQKVIKPTNRHNLAREHLAKVWQCFTIIPSSSQSAYQAGQIITTARLLTVYHPFISACL
jgi:hypothetical protein